MFFWYFIKVCGSRLTHVDNTNNTITNAKTKANLQIEIGANLFNKTGRNKFNSKKGREEKRAMMYAFVKNESKHCLRREKIKIIKKEDSEIGRVEKDGDEIARGQLAGFDTNNGSKFCIDRLTRLLLEFHAMYNVSSSLVYTWCV